MEQAVIIQEIFEDDKCQTLAAISNQLGLLLNYKIETLKSVSSHIVDIEFLDEVRSVIVHEVVPLYFGKTIRDLKCIIQDDTFRAHELFFRYNGPKKLTISKIAIPHSSLQEQVYSSIRDIIVAFKAKLDSLSNYFYQLERIDRFCTVMEPVESSFRDDYRRILLDERTWLHVEVTADGLATNIHLVGQCEQWSEKLQLGLLAWDHDKDIVENVMTIFDMVNFSMPVPSNDLMVPTITKSAEESATDARICIICLCAELPDVPGVPLPLCQNPLCGVYFHRSCLFQWLAATCGGRAPAFGVVTGNCPSCLQSVTCSEK